MKPKDEEKRSKIWKAVMLISSILIMLAIAYFITDSIVKNPLQGEWYSEETGYYLEVEDDREVTVKGTFGGVPMEVELYYTIDKSEKVVAIKANADSYEEAIDESDGKLTAGELDELLDEFATSYHYSIDNGKLTLTEREYGEQYIFTRIEK